MTTATLYDDLMDLQNKLELARSQAYHALDTGTVTKIGEDRPSHRGTVVSIVDTIAALDEAVREFNMFATKYGSQA